MIATSMGGDPMATVRVVPTEVQGSFVTGDTIPRVGKIVRIEQRSVDVVDADGHHATLALRESVVVDDFPKDKKGPGAATPESPFADRIKKIDDHTYEADRSLFKELVSGVTKPGGVRALPIVENGVVKGIKLYAVGPTTIPAAFGLKTGDTLVAINGDPIKDANQILDLYSKIDDLSQVQLSGTRGGKPLDMMLKLR